MEMIGLFIFVLAWVVGSTIGWYMIRRGQEEARPFNWRVFIGPFVYYPWLDRQ